MPALRVAADCKEGGKGQEWIGHLPHGPKGAILADSIFLAEQEF